MKKIGFFGGSFDPIHFGHINLAYSLMEVHGLDEVIFSPAYVSPHKVQSPPIANADQRLQMVELALEGHAKFSLYQKEVERGGSSFTIDTIKELSKGAKLEGIDAKYFLILGEDSLPSLHRWKDVEELISLSPPLVGCRGENVTKAISSLPPFLANVVEEGWTEILMLFISSTAIRQRLKKHLECSFLMPRVVLDFIFENQLYL